MTLLERPPDTLSPIESWLVPLVAAGVDPQEAVTEFLRASTALDRQTMVYAWNAIWARPAQRLPETTDWLTWFIRAGRGFGKTRCGAEGVRKLVLAGRARAVTIIGKSAADARDVMIEGPGSGLLAVHPPDVRPEYKPSVRTLVWPNGTIGHVRSAEDPDSVLGLNSELVWGDEPAAWPSGKQCWDNARLGLRLGKPHAIVTGTPRPLEWLRELEAEPGTVVTTGSTYENIGNLSPEFISLILLMYEGSRLGAQELHAQYLEDVEGALWRMATIDNSRFATFKRDDPWGSLITAMTDKMRLAFNLGEYRPAVGERRQWETWVGVDPPGETAECGIIVATAPKFAKAGRDHCVVLADMTIRGAPEEWGAQVIRAVEQWHADGVVVEKNQGGDMTRSTIHAVDPNVRVEKVTSSDSKADRAEPVSTLHAKGWLHFLGHLPDLEKQITTWVPDESDSPDRMDAFVHVVSRLLTWPREGVGTGSVGSQLVRR